LSSNSQTIVEKVALNSLKEMVLGLPLNFSILLKELADLHGVYGCRGYGLEWNIW
jgi:hypothetical protein